MKIALGQINSCLGAYSQNADKILSNTQQACDQGAALIVFPEMALFGYPACDLLERPQEVFYQEKALNLLIKKLPPKITVILGAVIKNPAKTGKPYLNVAVVAQKGKKVMCAPKQLLPSYDVFDETRFFEAGSKTAIIKVSGIGEVAVTVCEDMWAKEQNYKADPLSKVKRVKLVVNISASPFSLQKNKKRLLAAKRHIAKIKSPLVYVNQAGAQDELVFDGGSFVLGKKGEVLTQASFFKEELILLDLSEKQKAKKSETSDSEKLKAALVLGIRDFIHKTNLKKVHLGLSGGIDSALVACLTVEALGAENVVGVLLPGPYSSKESISDSEMLARNLNIKTHKIEIQSIFAQGMELKKGFQLDVVKEREDLAEQNLQARIRGMLLMQYANLAGSMLLSTANKSELATGYSTLYGDTCGGLMPIGDLTKNQVYEVARLYSEIPQNIFDKAPSAELAPNQKDQDSLPPYDILDRAVIKIVEEKKEPDSEVEKWLEKKLYFSEFKRWQSPPILKVSEHAFGRGRRIPIARLKDPTDEVAL